MREEDRGGEGHGQGTGHSGNETSLPGRAARGRRGQRWRQRWRQRWQADVRSERGGSPTTERGLPQARHQEADVVLQVFY